MISQKQRAPTNANVTSTKYASDKRGHNGWIAGSRYSVRANRKEIR